MKHLKKGRKFGREKKQRKALLRNLAREFIVREKIKTTLAKAKELKPFMEKIISQTKPESLASHRRVLAMIDKKAAERLFSSIAPAVKDRSGGYTKITRLGRRISDSAEMAIIELVK